MLVFLPCWAAAFSCSSSTEARGPTVTSRLQHGKPRAMMMMMMIIVMTDRIAHVCVCVCVCVRVSFNSVLLISA